MVAFERVTLFLQRRIFGILASIARRKDYAQGFSRYTKPQDEPATSRKGS